MNRESPGHTFQATELVHEAYLRLVGTDTPLNWNSRGHFFAAAAQAMRRVLIENARKRHSLRRGGNMRRHNVDEVEFVSSDPNGDIFALNEALEKLSEKDKTKARLVELRYFAGLTIDQAAELLGISATTAGRYWAYSRAWLHQEIIKGDGYATD